MTDALRIDDDQLTLGDDQMMFWEERPFTGIGVEHFPNGAIRCEMAYVNGLPEGVSRSYHSNGQLANEASYWKGALHGNSRTWTAQGRLVSEETYELGVLVRGSYFADDGTRTKTFIIDPQDATLLMYRKAYGREAPPV